MYGVLKAFPQERLLFAAKLIVSMNKCTPREIGYTLSICQIVIPCTLAQTEYDEPRLKRWSSNHESKACYPCMLMHVDRRVLGTG